MKLTGFTRRPFCSTSKWRFGPVARPGPAHQGHGLAFLHLIADGDEVLGVVRIARGVAVAVIDFNHQAVAIAVRRTR